MKRYLLFCGDVYYPNPGWGDFVGSFDTIDEAKSAVVMYGEWADIVDTATEEVVKQGTRYNAHGPIRTRPTEWTWTSTPDQR